MSDFKIRPSAGPSHPLVGNVEDAAATEGGATFEISGREAAVEGVASAGEIEPAELVQQIREGRLDIEQAIEVLVDRALRSQPALVGSEGLRREIRQALIDLAQDDPTLAALVSALKR